MSEARAKADDKAEKAGKKVAKDIEYDEGHKGKDDNKAEKAGKKVTKDIEYDEKKKCPPMSHIKKMCQDGKSVAEICKMHPDCDQKELKQMVADCKETLDEASMPMKKVNGKSVPAFAADGKGKNDLKKKGAAPKKGVNPFAKKDTDVKEALKGGQKKLDNDNDIDAKDLANLRVKKKDKFKEAAQAKCNSTAKDKKCPVHGMKECGSMYEASDNKKKCPPMSHIKKMCQDRKTVAEICKMHPDCDQTELKQMIAACKKQMAKK